MQVSLSELETILSKQTIAKECQLTAVVPQPKISKTIFGNVVYKHLTVRCIINPLMDHACRAIIHQYYISKGLCTWAIDAYNNGPKWRQYCYKDSKVICQHAVNGTKYLECYLPFDHCVNTMYSCDGEWLDNKAVERVLSPKHNDASIPVILRYTLSNVQSLVIDGTEYTVV